MRMFSISCIAVIYALLCTSRAQVDLETCGSDDSTTTCSLFFREVDKAFRQENVLYTLRKAFFPSEGRPPILFDVELTLDIETVPIRSSQDPVRCSDFDYVFRNRSVSFPPSKDDVCKSGNGRYECGQWSFVWRHQWSRTVLTYIIEREDLELLRDTNFVAFSAATFNSFDTSVFSMRDAGLEDDGASNSSAGATTEDMVEFQFTIPYLPCLPDEGVLLDAWEDILPWLELYARNSDNLQLEEIEFSQESRGFASREGVTRRGGLTVPLLTIVHILLNIVFALAVTYFLYKYHNYLNQLTGKQYQLVASMYWSIVILCLTGAVVIIIGNGYLYYALSIIENRSLPVVGFRIASDATVLILVFVEFVASMLTPHDPSFFIPHLIRRTLCCNQCCRCCGSTGRLNFLRRAVLGFAMWIIIVFLQLIVASILPLAVVVVVNPVPSLAFISIMVALFFCLVIFVAYFLNAFEGNYIARHRLSKDQRRASKTSWDTLKRNKELVGNWLKEKLILVAQAFVFLVIFAVAALIIILYLNFVRAGANANSVAGLFISLAPSALLGAITWAAKKHLFKELEEEIEAEKIGSEEIEETEEEEEERPVFQLGGFTFQPHRRRTTRRKKSFKRNGHAVSFDQEVSPDVDDKEENNSKTALEIDQPHNPISTDEEREEHDGEIDENYGRAANDTAEKHLSIAVQIPSAFLPGDSNTTML